MYRRPPDDLWLKGRIVNVSESGVLFGPAELQPGTHIEVMLSPPIQLGSRAPGKHLCVVEVVRSTMVGDVAARFRACRFLLES